LKDSIRFLSMPGTPTYGPSASAFLGDDQK